MARKFPLRPRYLVIGPGNPLAATIFALLTASMSLPIDYMEVIDGHGYDWRGVTGAFLADALIISAARGPAPGCGENRGKSRPIDIGRRWVADDLHQRKR